MVKKLVLLVVFSQFFFAFAQEPAFSLDLKTVDVVEKRKPKVESIGKHNAFTIFLNTHSLENVEEIAVFLIPNDTNSYWIQKAFMRMDFRERPEREIPIVLRLRAVSADTTPGEVIFQDSINLMNHLNARILEVDIEGQHLSLDKNGIYLSVEAINPEDRKLMSIEMSSRTKNMITCSKSTFEPLKWKKRFYWIDNKQKNLKGGLQLLQK